MRTNEIFEINHLPNRTVKHDGKEYLFFSGTAYLGLPQHPAFQQLMTEAIGQYGTVFGSSRNGNLRLSIYEESEAKLATSVGAPTALTLSSGMMAGQVIVNWLRSQNATFIYGPNAHPALWHQPVVTLPKLSFADWSAQITNQVRSVSTTGDKPGPVAILVNSIEAVRSEYYNFDWVNDLPDELPITLIVDDSHGLGILNEGRGIWPQITCKPNRAGGPIRLLVTASLAKAMGMPGGVILGDRDTLVSVRQTAFFGACSPMPPACLDVYLRADALYADGYERLAQNIALAERLLLPTGLFRHATGYPVFFTEHDDLYPYLLENGILVYSFAYPTAADRANTRIVISAFHELADIECLGEKVNTYTATFHESARR
ncbi:aminotransferase class I/II-fold pyridoxal phosphate-dependent enzyme [Spirosoma validum]|uniref:aminotransferase class I/II-fold pyridoxal phosphate-dependent enzyme n=1 Tax=Spirosoma validum TaxID=2771355 RepID=UPI00293BE3AA|nr:aminotransferase class I/II-fold pyridoxal phosphate-dependent enzyme [Spirosoma validum]